LASGKSCRSPAEAGRVARYANDGEAVTVALRPSIGTKVQQGAKNVKGVVKFFNAQKGYGFIAPDNGGNDVFVHVSELERSGLNTLNEGDIVTFESKVDPKKGKPNAVGIKRA
jgi:CspA family cold shock protein